MRDNNIIVLLDEYVTLKNEISELKTSINRIKWFALILIIIGTFILSASVNSIKETNIAQHHIFGQKLAG